MNCEFDVSEFCDNLKATKPPYQCPIENCGKFYKSFTGIQFHMYNYDHLNPERNSPTPSKKGTGRKKNRSHHRSVRPSSSPQDWAERSKSVRDTLTYAEAQRLVEIDVNGNLRRIDINLPLKVVHKVKREGFSSGEAEAENADSTARRTVDGPAPAKKPLLTVRLPEAQFTILSDYVKPTKKHAKQSAFYRYIEQNAEEMDKAVEYDMDDQDYAWLKIVNDMRKKEGSGVVSLETFEFIMDRFEKEAHFQSQSTGHGGGSPIDEDAVCNICMDGECQNSNVILFCDMCNLAVHQECYGVPYIPEGQWLCRRCLQSPSRAVDCVLCPNKGGAFKQTDDGRWAHVICGIWIPEVIFANTVFLEPIEGVKNIPSARWKLTCYICKQKGIGACIQCHKTNCYTAFHVTCAQQAGLYMKVESIKSSTAPMSPSGMAIRKTAYCDVHMPSNMKGTSMIVNSESENDLISVQQKSKLKMRKARKILAEKRNEVPVVSIPIIPEQRIEAITKKLHISQKQSLLRKLVNYWTLKRQSRNGVPLLRRLQSNHMSKTHEQKIEDGKSAILKAQLKYWQRLRQDLEKARLLVELIRKREKLKREQMRVQCLLVSLKLTPFLSFVQRIYNELKEIDAAGVFALPVDTSEVPDYLEYISCPMDMAAMQQKINDYKYTNMDDFSADVDLMVRNCMLYNAKDTPFYKAALRMRDQGFAVLRAARRMADHIGFDDTTGLLRSESNRESELRLLNKTETLTGESLGEYVADLASKNITPEQILNYLLEKMDLAILEKGRKSRIAKLIRKEIIKVRRMMAHGNECFSEVPSTMDESSADETDGLPTVALPLEVVKDASRPEEGTAGSDRRKHDELSVSSTSTEASSVLMQGNVTPSPGTVSRRTAVLFASKKFSRRPSPLVKSPLIISATEQPKTEAPQDTSSLRTISKVTRANTKPFPAVVTKSLESYGFLPKSVEESATKTPGTANPVSRKKALVDGPSSSKDSECLPQKHERFDQYTGSLSNILLSASEMDELSSTETDDSDSMLTSRAAIPGNNRPVTSTTVSGRRLRSSDDMYTAPLTALDLVWAKCRGYPWYPAMIIDPKMPRGYTFNGVPIPTPPAHVLDLQSRFTGPVYLILFFDAKRTWQWLPRDKLEPLGVDSEYDQEKLSSNKKPAIKKAVMGAYEKALRHQRKIDDGIEDDDSQPL